MIVTLCGSTRFEANFHEAALELGRRGIICFTLAAFPSVGNSVSERGQALEESNYDKVMLDLGYLEKISKSDAILILGDGYIGQSTAREILWADQFSKKIVSQDSVARHNWDNVVRRLRGIDPDNSYMIVSKARRVLGDKA